MKTSCFQLHLKILTGLLKDHDGIVFGNLCHNRNITRFNVLLENKWSLQRFITCFCACMGVFYEYLGKYSALIDFAHNASLLMH